jgi:hypothetical protein
VTPHCFTADGVRLEKRNLWRHEMFELARSGWRELWLDRRDPPGPLLAAGNLASSWL